MTHAAPEPAAQTFSPATLFPLSDGIGSVSLVQHVDQESSQDRCIFHRAIRQAFDNGYRSNTETGEVTGPKGFILQGQRRGKQRYGTITLSVPDMPKRQYAVPIHKVVAHALWKDASFAEGIHVRHLDGDAANNRAENLALGTAPENERDKSAEVKSRSARVARAAQAAPHNVRFSYHDVEAIRERFTAHRGPSGRVKRGIVKELAEHYNVTSAAISAVASGKNYGY